MTTFEELAANLQAVFVSAKRIAGHFDIDTDHIRLTKPLKLATIEDFFVQLFGTEAALPDVPFGQSTIDHFTIDRADDAADLPTRVAIGVSFKGVHWSPSPGVDFALTGTTVEFWGASITGSMSGAVTIEDVEFDATVAWPSLVVIGQLARKPMRAPDPAALATAHGLGAGSSGSPTLRVLRLHAALRMHQVEIEVGASDLCAIGPVHLDEVDARFQYTGGLNAAFTGELGAAFHASGLDFAVRGAKTLKGWEIDASAYGTTELASLVDGLSSHLFPSGSHDLANIVPRELASTPISGAIGLSASTADRHVTLTAAITVSDNAGTMAFEVDITPDTLVVRAVLHLGDLTFEVDFARSDTGTLLAAQFASERALTMHLSDLVAMSHLGDGESSAAIGGDIEIGLRDALIAMWSSPAGTTPSTTKYLVAADIDGGIDLSGMGDLPIVGSMLPQDLSLRLSLAPVLVTDSWEAEQDDLDELRGEGGPQLPEKLANSTLGVKLQLPGEDLPVDLGLSLGDASSGDSVPIDAADPPSKQPADDAPPGLPVGSPLTWKTINKSLGPVSIERVGLGLDKADPEDPKIRLLLDSSLGLGPLSLSLVGFGASYGLSSQSIDFELHGMGIDFKQPPLEVGGAFARIETRRDGRDVVDYLGKVNLKLEDIGIAASGGFTTLDGAPSMFVYGVLNTPLGGPPFFFVEGLAAGFGFNRRLTVPELGEVEKFPFVADAIGIADGNDAPTMSEALQSLASHVQPALGEYFLAAGVKFTSFKLLDSFILVVVSAGRDLKIDAVGISRYQSPPIVPKGVPAMVNIELQISVAVRPAEGFIRVQASLSNESYVYSPAVQLSGGFAFQAWFAGEHAGDFVISAGGYHPKFKKPAHYPDVKRIGLTFKVPGFDIFIKGQAYFALTPSMLMAGGSLEAVGTFGKVHASFGLYLDFMMQWEPYHYDLEVRISIHARWWKFKTHATARLHLWGPEFSGFAEVHWTVISFDVSFGAGLPWAAPISWAHFQKSFLPHQVPAGKKTAIVNVAPTASVTAGEVAVIDGPNGPIHVVNPKDLVITINSVLPIDTLNLQLGTPAVEKVTTDGKRLRKNNANAVDLGVGPVGVHAIKRSELTLGTNGADFVHAVKTKAFPAAMWGKPAPGGKPSLNGERTVTAGGSVELRLNDAVAHHGEARAKRSDFAYDDAKTATVGATNAVRVTETGKPLTRLLNAKAASKRRSRILTDLGLPGETTVVSPDFLSGLRGSPRTVVVS